MNPQLITLIQVSPQDSTCAIPTGDTAWTYTEPFPSILELKNDWDFYGLKIIEQIGKQDAMSEVLSLRGKIRISRYEYKSYKVKN